MGSRIAAVLAGTVLCAGMAAADIQAKEVASREAWVYGIHLGENGGAGHPFVIEVNRKSPAKLAGLKTGDEIVRIQDAPVRGLHDAVRALNDLPAGRIAASHQRPRSRRTTTPPAENSRRTRSL